MRATTMTKRFRLLNGGGLAVMHLLKGVELQGYFKLVVTALLPTFTDLLIIKFNTSTNSL